MSDSNGSGSCHYDENKLRYAIRSESLQSIARVLIQTIRRPGHPGLSRLQNRIRPFLEDRATDLSPRKLLLLYHPDRSRHYLSELENALDEGSREKLEKFQHVAVALEWSHGEENRALENSRSESDGESHRKSGFRRTGTDSAYETYDTGEEVFDETFGFRRAETYPYDDEFQDEKDNFSFFHNPGEEEGRKTFLQGLQEALFGNLDLPLDPTVFDRLEGELDLSSREIEDLTDADRIQWVTILNLSDNVISDLRDLKTLEGLEELYLAGNDLENLDGLESLRKLRILDISENPLVDLEAITGLKSLEILIAEGVPLEASVRKLLQSRGCVIFD